MKKRKTRVFGDWTLYVATRHYSDGRQLHYVIGERNGEKFWFYHTPSHKEAEKLMMVMDPDRVLRAIFPSKRRSW